MFLSLRRKPYLPTDSSIVNSISLKCVRAFEELPHHSVRRVDWRQQAKDTCTYCGMGIGYDYWIHDWSSLVMQNRELVSTIVQ